MCSNVSEVSNKFSELDLTFGKKEKINYSSQNGYEICKHCDSTFGDFQARVAHFCKPHKCIHCYERFLFDYQLKMHKSECCGLKKTDGEVNSFHCSTCDSTFETLKLLSHHRSLCSGKQDTKKCNVCQEKFKGRICKNCRQKTMEKNKQEVINKNYSLRNINLCNGVQSSTKVHDEVLFTSSDDDDDATEVKIYPFRHILVQPSQSLSSEALNTPEIQPSKLPHIDKCDKPAKDIQPKEKVSDEQVCVRKTRKKNLNQLRSQIVRTEDLDSETKKSKIKLAREELSNMNVSQIPEPKHNLLTKIKKGCENKIKKLNGKRKMLHTTESNNCSSSSSSHFSDNEGTTTVSDFLEENFKAKGISSVTDLFNASIRNILMKTSVEKFLETCNEPPEAIKETRNLSMKRKVADDTNSEKNLRTNDVKNIKEGNCKVSEMVQQALGKSDTELELPNSESLPTNNEQSEQGNKEAIETSIPLKMRKKQCRKVSNSKISENLIPAAGPSSGKETTNLSMKRKAVEHSDLKKNLRTNDVKNVKEGNKVSETFQQLLEKSDTEVEVPNSESLPTKNNEQSEQGNKEAIKTSISLKMRKKRCTKVSNSKMSKNLIPAAGPSSAKETTNLSMKRKVVNHSDAKKNLRTNDVENVKEGNGKVSEMFQQILEKSGTEVEVPNSESLPTNNEESEQGNKEAIKTSIPLKMRKKQCRKVSNSKISENLIPAAGPSSAKGTTNLSVKRKVVDHSDSEKSLRTNDVKNAKEGNIKISETFQQVVKKICTEVEVPNSESLPTNNHEFEQCNEEAIETSIELKMPKKKHRRVSNSEITENFLPVAGPLTSNYVLDENDDVSSIPNNFERELEISNSILNSIPEENITYSPVSRINSSINFDCILNTLPNETCGFLLKVASTTSDNYRCPKCGKLFKQIKRASNHYPTCESTRFRRNMLVSLDEIVFICINCHYHCSHLSELNTHKETCTQIVPNDISNDIHHYKDTDKVHVCKKCGYACKSCHALSQHECDEILERMKTCVVGVEKLTVNYLAHYEALTKLKCSACDEVFFDDATFEKHADTHLSAGIKFAKKYISEGKKRVRNEMKKKIKDSDAFNSVDSFMKELVEPLSTISSIADPDNKLPDSKADFTMPYENQLLLEEAAEKCLSMEVFTEFFKEAGNLEMDNGDDVDISETQLPDDIASEMMDPDCSNCMYRKNDPSRDVKPCYKCLDSYMKRYKEERADSAPKEKGVEKIPTNNVSNIVLMNSVVSGIKLPSSSDSQNVATSASTSAFNASLPNNSAAPDFSQATCEHENEREAETSEKTLQGIFEAIFNVENKKNVAFTLGNAKVLCLYDYGSIKEPYSAYILRSARLLVCSMCSISFTPSDLMQHLIEVHKLSDINIYII